MNESSTEKLHVQFKEDDLIGVCHEQDDTDTIKSSSGNNEATKLSNTDTHAVLILDDKDDFPPSLSAEKSTSSLPLEANTKTSNNTNSLKFWDQTLKIIVLVGAISCIAILGIVLIEEKNRKVIELRQIMSLLF